MDIADFSLEHLKSAATFYVLLMREDRGSRKHALRHDLEMKLHLRCGEPALEERALMKVTDRPPAESTGWTSSMT